MYLRQAAASLKLDRLEWICVAYLVNKLNIDNVFLLLKASHEMHEVEIKDFCLKFALENYNEFISNKKGFDIIDIDLFKEVVLIKIHDQKRFEVNTAVRMSSFSVSLH